MGRLNSELDQLDDDERIGFLSMVELMLRQAVLATDVQAIAVRENTCYLTAVAARRPEDHAAA